MRKLFIAADRAWIGECRQDAHTELPIPAADDPRWIQGVPTALDTQVLTLCPFYPSGRLDVSVEIKRSQPLSRYPNHPPFQGCKAWMHIPTSQMTA